MERLLHLQGFRLERSSTPQKIPDQECSVLNHGCPFCESSVIDSQTVYETALSRIFYNFKPTIPGAHFLIVPKRHLPTTDRLREDEVRDLHGIAQRLGKVLEEKTGRSDIKMYTQDGPSAGQTVGHTHMHMMLTPQALRHLFFSLNYQNEKPISAEEMRAVVEDIGQRLSLH
jgi:histidine triad (HIT) family protein